MATQRRSHHNPGYLVLLPAIHEAIENDFNAGKTKSLIMIDHQIGRAHLKQFFPERFRTHNKEPKAIDTAPKAPAKRGRPRKQIAEN